MMLHSEFYAWFGCLFQTLQAKRTLLINIHIEQVPATLITFTQDPVTHLGSHGIKEYLRDFPLPAGKLYN